MNRRSFLLSAASLPAVAAVPLKPGGTTIVFQGDSITDSGRDRSSTIPNANLGVGYVAMAATTMLVQKQLVADVYNRGVAGDRVSHLAARWQQDCIALQPDIVSVLVGVNDFLGSAMWGVPGTASSFEAALALLVGQTLAALPTAQVVLCEPFLLPCGAVHDWMHDPFSDYRAAVLRVAQASNAVFVPLQDAFDRALALAEPSSWAGDGVHPTPLGHSLVAEAWLDAVGL